MNTRKLSLIIAGVAVLAAAGVFGLKTAYESKVRNGIENFLATLPEPMQAKAGKIDVSFFSKSVVITDLTGSYKGKNDFTFSFGKIAASGINADAAKAGSGITSIAKSLEVENAAHGSELMHAAVAQYSYRDISGDLARIIAESVKAAPAIIAFYNDPQAFKAPAKEREFMGSLAPLMSAMETMTIGSGSLRGYSATMPLHKGIMGTMTIAEGEMGKYSLREMGKVAMRNLALSQQNASAPMLLIESMGMDGAILPSFAEMFKLIGEGVTSSTLLATTLQGQQFALKNLSMKNMTVRDPQNLEQTIMSLAAGSFSYSAGASHKMNLDFDGLSIVKALLEKGGELPEEALALMPDPLTYSGAVDLSAAAKGEDRRTYDIECKKIALKENALGGFATSFAISDLNAISLMMGTPGPAALGNFDLSVTDTGASNVLYVAMAAGQEDVTPESLRAEAISQLPAPESLPNDALRGLVDAVREFLQKPGSTLRVTLAPAAPLNFMELQTAALTDPDKLGLSASATPAQ